MSILSTLQTVLGNASKTTVEDYHKLLESVLIEGESAEQAFKTFRDLIIFTNFRLMIIDIQGAGVKKSFKSVPYSHISVFDKNTAGTVDINSEVVIYLRDHEPLKLQFSRGKNIDVVYKLLARKVLG